MSLIHLSPQGFMQYIICSVLNFSLFYLQMYIVVELQLCREIRVICSENPSNFSVEIHFCSNSLPVLLNPSNNIYVFHVLKYGFVCISIVQVVEIYRDNVDEKVYILAQFLIIIYSFCNKICFLWRLLCFVFIFISFLQILISLTTTFHNINFSNTLV